MVLQDRKLPRRGGRLTSLDCRFLCIDVAMFDIEHED